MKLVLLSDTHLTDRKQIYGRDPRACLRQAVTHLATHHGDADLCLLLGDLTDSGSPSQYAALMEELARLPMPHRLLIGNHDHRGNFLAAFGSAHADAHGWAQGSVDVGGTRCLLLDSHVPGRPGGSLDGGRLDAFAAMLDDSDRPCLVFLHHPPLKTGLPAFDPIGLAGRDAFAAVVASRKDRIAGIFFGHCHMAVAGSVAGVPAFGIRSTLYQGLPNLTDDQFMNAPGLPPAYGVVVAEDGALAVHHVEFGYDGPVISARLSKESAA